MPDILLIQPPVRDFYLTAKRTIPYGLACLAAALEQNGFSTTILDALAVPNAKTIALPLEMDYLTEFYGRPDISPFALFHGYKHFGLDFDAIGQAARQSDAFLAGISSLFTPYDDMALQTAAAVRKHHPGCRIVLGGHHATAMPERLIAFPAVDYVLRGEAEQSLPRLAGIIKRGREEDQALLKTIDGIVFRKKDGGLHINPPASLKQLDEEPLPAMDLVNHDFYLRKKRGSLVVTACRGCPLSCSYCAVGRGNLPFRRRSSESVLREIDTALSQYPVGFIDFEDENLTLDKPWVLALMAGLKYLLDGRGVELRAMNGLYPPSLDETVMAAMKEAGFKTLNLSVGSFDPLQQKRFNRPDMKADHERIMNWCERHGLDSVTYIIAGAPHQTAKTTLRDIMYLYGKNTLAGLSIFYPAPGSRDYDLCSRLNLLPDHLILMRSSALPLSHTTTRTQAVTLLRLSRLINFIKYLKQQNIELPGPAPFSNRIPADSATRTDKGLLLLSWFLHDGKIRGLTRSGHVYEHTTDPDLTRQTLDFLVRFPGVA